MAEEKPGWYYFGCARDGGHYLHHVHRGRVHAITSLERRLTLDKVLPPLKEEGNLYKAAYNVLGGLGYVALSWWDRSGDTRSGSNSTVFCPIPNAAIIHTLEFPQLMLDKAPQLFPWVFKRLPQPLELFDG